MDEAFADNSLYHVPPFPDLVGREAQKQFIAAFLAGFPDFHVAVDEDITMGTTSAHRWHAEGTYTGQSPMLPGPPSGKHATAEGCLILHWRDGKVAETWHFGDWLGWLQRIGVIPLKRSVSNTSDQGHRVFDSLLDAVRRWYVCDLIRDCVVPVLCPVQQYLLQSMHARNRYRRSPCPSRYCLRIHTNQIANRGSVNVVQCQLTADRCSLKRAPARSRSTKIPPVPGCATRQCIADRQPALLFTDTHCHYV